MLFVNFPACPLRLTCFRQSHVCNFHPVPNILPESVPGLRCAADACYTHRQDGNRWAGFCIRLSICFSIRYLKQVWPSSGKAVYSHMPILRVACAHAHVARAMRWAAMARVMRAIIARFWASGEAGEKRSPKWEILWLGCRWTTVQYLTPL